jgi:hypothetical protein
MGHLLRLFIVAVCCMAAAPAFAAWQMQRQGTYTYYVDGTSIACPIIQGTYFKIDHGNGVWEFYHPTMANSWTVFATDGTRIFSKNISTNSPNTPYSQITCDLGTFKRWYDGNNIEMNKNRGSDFFPYYASLFQESDILLRACKRAYGAY